MAEKYVRYVYRCDNPSCHAEHSYYDQDEAPWTCPTCNTGSMCYFGSEIFGGDDTEEKDQEHG
jgi:hypothetical protein